MGELLINDVFWTFQGEGANAGRRALFVRMPYCNLHCSWCDTSFNSYKRWTEEEFVKFANQERAGFAVLTGGEPTMNKQLPRIIELLKKEHFVIAVESNGTFPVPAGIDFVTISPKRDANYAVDPDAWIKASEFKYVVDEGFDFNFAKRHNVDDGRRYSLSPEFNKMQESLLKIYEFIKENPGWRISLQTHKWMAIP